MGGVSSSTIKWEGSIRVRILLFVVVNIITVEKKHWILGNVHPIVHKVLGRIVGLSHPKRRARALHLKKCEGQSAHSFMYGTHFFDDGPDIREELFVFGWWPIISADHHIELCVRLGLDIGMRRDEGEEPQNDTGSLNEVFFRLVGFR
jgi:hypothetical protein